VVTTGTSARRPGSGAAVVPPAGVHGGDGAAVAAALGVAAHEVLDLSASLNPVAPDPRPVVARHLDSLTRYPDPGRATAALAAAMDVDPERVLLTNGGAEAIALVASVLGGHVDEPEFSLHPRGPGGSGPRWRSNPHNPTGRLAASEERAGVWDEAFYPLAAGRWTRGDVDAVVVGSLTKVFACPGLRMGYVVADAPLLYELRKLQPAWSVSGPAAAALPDLLSSADLQGWAAEVRTLRIELTALLEEHGLAPLPSDANFVLCGNAPGLRARLIPERVVVRDCASFGLPDHARVAVPDRAGLRRVAAALERTAR